MKNKLIELLNPILLKYRFDAFENSDKIADHLIANGGTIQRWIPVEERLPDLDEVEENKYLAYENIGVIARIAGCKKSCYRVYERAHIKNKVVCRWKYPWGTISDEKITHWMPLPEPPKED